MSDELLRVIARRLAEQIGYAPEGKYTLALEEWLREMGVGRLLEAAEAMYQKEYGDYGEGEWQPDSIPGRYEAAKAEVMGERDV